MRCCEAFGTAHRRAGAGQHVVQHPRQADRLHAPRRARVLLHHAARRARHRALRAREGAALGPCRCASPWSSPRMAGRRCLPSASRAWSGRTSPRPTTRSSSSTTARRRASTSAIRTPCCARAARPRARDPLLLDGGEPRAGRGAQPGLEGGPRRVIAFTDDDTRPAAVVAARRTACAGRTRGGGRPRRRAVAGRSHRLRARCRRTRKRELRDRQRVRARATCSPRWAGSTSATGSPGARTPTSSSRCAATA